MVLAAAAFIWFGGPLIEVWSCDDTADLSVKYLPEFVPKDVSESLKSDNRDLCIILTAIEDNDKRLCPYITNEQIRADCFAGRNPEPITKNFYANGPE